jgi:glycosyltransferase involved in cell wall biosynthesis
MNNSPLVSIVIPTYNHAPMLQRALATVVEQTYQNWNAIVVNNFSTDNTLEVVAAFNDPRIQCVNFRNNGVIGASRNEGIVLATGKYVAFLDSDDTWFPTKLEKCVEILESGSDLVCHAEYWIDESGKSRLVAYGPSEAATHHNLIYKGNRISTSATVVRTALLKEVHGFDVAPELISTEDYDLWIRLAAKSDRFAFISEPLGEYHRHDNNVSANIEKHLAAELALLAKHFSANTRFENMIARRRRKALAYYGAGRSLHRTRKHFLALQKYSRSLVIWPLSLRLYAAVMLSLMGSFKPKSK